MTENYKRLYRNTNDIMFTGVCSGIAEYANFDPTVVRLLFVMAFFVTGPGILLAYLIMMAVVPPTPISS
jgi:phage shock protein C